MAHSASNVPATACGHSDDFSHAAARGQTRDRRRLSHERVELDMEDVPRPASQMRPDP
jgi:hypothetical protein